MNPLWSILHLLDVSDNVSAAATSWQKGEWGFDENSPAFMCSQRGRQPREWSASIYLCYKEYSRLRHRPTGAKNTHTQTDTHTRTHTPRPGLKHPNAIDWITFFPLQPLRSCAGWQTTAFTHKASFLTTRYRLMWVQQTLSVKLLELRCFNRNILWSSLVSPTLLLWINLRVTSYRVGDS